MRFYTIWVQHITNPLHIYCRLIDFGLSTDFSRKLGVFYEKRLYPFLLRDLKQTWNLLRKGSL
jgi:hypothetical protein